MIDQLGDPKTSFDAQDLGAAGMIWQTSDDHAVLYKQIDLTPGAAQGAGRGDFALRYAIPFAGLFR